MYTFDKKQRQNSQLKIKKKSNIFMYSYIYPNIWKILQVASNFNHSILNLTTVYCITGTQVAQWLRRCATNRKDAGSIPDGVTGIFHWPNPSDRTMVLGSNQPLTEMSTRNISWGKNGRCVRLTILPQSWAIVT